MANSDDVSAVTVVVLGDAVYGICDFAMVVYGAVDCRCATKEDDFGALGANTAHGRTPTKRSPTGLASGDS